MLKVNNHSKHEVFCITPTRERANQRNFNYTTEDVKKMDRDRLLNLITYSKELSGKEGGRGLEGGQSGANKLSKVIGVPQPTIWNYIQCLYLEPETLAIIGRGEETGKTKI